MDAVVASLLDPLPLSFSVSIAMSSAFFILEVSDAPRPAVRYKIFR